LLQKKFFQKHIRRSFMLHVVYDAKNDRFLAGFDKENNPVWARNCAVATLYTEEEARLISSQLCVEVL